MAKQTTSFFCVASLVVAGAMIAGCGETGNQVTSTSGEIEQFINENPDLVASPEDSPASEADEFAAGRE